MTMIGEVFSRIEGLVEGNYVVDFFNKEGKLVYKMYHSQDCCENVYLADVVGDPDDLINTPIISYEEITNDQEPPEEDHDECWQWTFYKFSTIKGSVTLRWFGSSNGYYSVEVTLRKFKV